ncbi:uncharacterized protein LOC122667963 [Telopea speciosissima]|uniref:uncharacterized protein LOC122667963 n=1 Tax=Telopea speciosissima TaxID=54955 RepID=UPI001CC66E0E|nr:uncharacterized protein LOC122667963 [Telopea speciosissima]
MGKFQEEKALAGDRCLSSLEEQISVFYGEDSGDFDRPVVDDFGDYESNGSGDHDSTERTLFWESKQDLLLEILEYSSSTGSKLREEVKKALQRARERELCKCSNPSFNGCPKCFRQAVVDHLSDKGLNAALCKSKWKSNSKIHGGTHEYIDVIFSSSSSLGHKKESRYLIELDFRAEFEMGKACDEYRNLVNQLPEFFVGKLEKLNAILRVVCDAAKRSVSEMKIHMGPWRKKRFMQMKWSAPYQRCSSSKKQSSIDSSVLSRQVHMSIPKYCLQFAAPTALEVT